jgi:superfamily II DNA or RNA helicase
LDQEPFNVAVADLYRSRFRRIPGVVYTAGVRHANHVAASFRAQDQRPRRPARPRSELAEILAAFERGEVDVLCNAMLLAEGWNPPRATICMHLRRPPPARLSAARRPSHPRAPPGRRPAW